MRKPSARSLRGKGGDAGNNRSELSLRRRMSHCIRYRAKLELGHGTRLRMAGGHLQASALSTMRSNSFTALSIYAWLSDAGRPCVCFNKRTMHERSRPTVRDISAGGMCRSKCISRTRRFSSFVIRGGFVVGSSGIANALTSDRTTLPT